MEVKIGSLRRFRVAVIVPVVLFVLPLFALAGGGQHYPNGAEAFLIGIAPPPGFYVKDYNYFYTADKLKDNSGNTVKLAKRWAGIGSIECLWQHSKIHLDLQVKPFGGILWHASFCSCPV